MVRHLEATVCPEGTRVWPVQSQEWLDAHIPCGVEGDVNVKSSKTDYIILTTEGWDRLHALELQKVTITGGHLVDLLPFIIAFYEVRHSNLKWMKAHMLGVGLSQHFYI